MSELSFAKQFLAALDTRPIKLPSDYAEDPRKLPAQRPYILPKSSVPMTKRPRLSTATSSTLTSGAKLSEQLITVQLKSLRNPPYESTLPSQTPSTSIHALKSHISKELGAPLDKIKLLYQKKPASDTKTLKDLLSGSGSGTSTPSADNAAMDVDRLELSVMIIGGAASINQQPDSTPAGVATSPGVAAPQPTLPESVKRETPAHVQAAAESLAKAAEADEAETGELAAAGISGEAMTIGTTGEATRDETIGATGQGPVAQGLSGPDVLRTPAFWDDLKGYLTQRIRDEASSERVFGLFKSAVEKEGLN
ncbi:hypothetical protein L228DRAFT_284531 [Xylona heveae TC161]|uniref:Ubiquitin-like domain-containing protein n=1 Tax=Xylona heveae (strain CBS 132557 / TC161) TaxID=1328760 RepID=A0A165AJB4_XYLHT|nr:hypothetical protein L228DRAFT_284531 [Xylona heveae TC161]KZF20573.1 hypothetical protein L228DRAFT_284531 [Xylona heveae TC161]